MNPSSAKKEMAIAAAAAVNRGLRNRLMSIIGWAVRSSAATSRPRMTRAAARVVTVAAEAQPQPGAWMMPYTIRLIATTDRAKPRQSTGGVRGSREGGNRQADSGASTAEIVTVYRDGDHATRRP